MGYRDLAAQTSHSGRLSKAVGARACGGRPPQRQPPQPAETYAHYRRRKGSRLARVACKVAAGEDVRVGEPEDVELPELATTDSEEAAAEFAFDDPDSWDSEPLVQPMPSPDVQQTLLRSFFLSNFTQHSDEYASIRVRPALGGEGRYFVRVPEGTIGEAAEAEVEAESAKMSEMDSTLSLESDKRRRRAALRRMESDEQSAEKIMPRGENEEVVLAIAENAVRYPEDSLFTTLEQDDVRVFAVEGLLSALEACGVDNARIEVEGNGELPAYDGSAAGFAHLVKWAGVRKAPGADGRATVPKRRRRPQKVITVRDGDSFVSLMPSSTARVSYGIDHTAEAPVIGKQWASWAPTDAGELHYRWAIAPARAYFASKQERFDRLAEGYFKACYDELVATADGKTYVRLDELRFTDEPARRRLLEFIGDLALLSEDGRGGIPDGHIVAFQATRALHLRFIDALKRVSAQDS